MPSLNRAQVIGHLGQDPEIRYMPDGTAACNLSIATSEKWKDKNTGEMKEATEWHRISMFGRTAEVAAEYLRKGSMVYIEGQLRTRKWQDKTGADRYTTEIRCDRMLMLKTDGERRPVGNKQSETAGKSSGRQQESTDGFGGLTEMEDDIPF